MPLLSFTNKDSFKNFVLVGNDLRNLKVDTGFDLRYVYSGPPYLRSAPSQPSSSSRPGPYLDSIYARWIAQSWQNKFTLAVLV